MDLDGGIQGLIHLSEISHGVVKDIREHVRVGEEVEAKVINFEPNKKRIGLSLKALIPEPKQTTQISSEDDFPTEEETSSNASEAEKSEEKPKQTKKSPAAKKSTAKKETASEQSQ